MMSVLGPASNAIGLHFYPIWEAVSLDEWLFNGGPYQLIVYIFASSISEIGILGAKLTSKHLASAPSTLQLAGK